MRDETKQALWAVGRRLVATGLVLAVVWVVILLLREAATAYTQWAAVDRASPWGGAERIPVSIDWSVSLWTKRPISVELAGRLGATLRWLSLGGLFSLAVAGVALSLGATLARAKGESDWLAWARRALGYLLVNAWVTIPALGAIVTSGAFVQVAVWWGWTPPMQDGWRLWWPIALAPGLLAAGLLVQVGLGEMAQWRQQGGGKPLAFSAVLALRLVITLLRMAGGLLVLALLAERVMDVPGLGRLLLDSLEQEDFALVLAVAWRLAVTVALAKLAAALLEIGGRYLAHRAGLPERANATPHPRRIWPWLALPAGLVLLPLVLGVGAPVFSPFAYNETHYADELTPPGPTYRLGTDYLGRDQLSRIIFAFRFSLVAGLAAAAVTLMPAAAWGWLARRLRRSKGRWAETWHDLVLLPAETLMAFPWLVAGALAAVLLRPWHGLGPAILVLALLLLPRAARMMAELYGSSLGVGHAKRVLVSLAVMAVLAVGAALIYEVTLSFEGYGVPPPNPVLGRMLSEESRLYMYKAPWLATWPTLAVILLIVGWPFLGNTLAERFGFRSRAAWSKFME